MKQFRGARIHAEIVGFGMSSDACHITQPSAEGAARAMRAVFRDSCLAPEQIGYINAHGTATPANDPTETAAIRSVFGPHAQKLAVSSTKSMHGHALGTSPPWSASPPPWHCAMGSCLQPPTTTSPTPIAIWTSSPTTPAAPRWSMPSRIRSRSVD